MKYLSITLALMLCSLISTAQPWIENYPKTTNIHQVRANFEDWKKQQKQLMLEEAGKEELPRTILKEGNNYHYERWNWHWENHSDEDGNMLSPLLQWKEFQRLQKAQLIYANAKTTNNQSNWTFAGPDSSTGGYSGIGRINVVGFHPTDHNTYIAGTAGGGCWRTQDDGVTWTSMYDNLPVLGVSDIDYNPLNPNTIYLCTGDRDASDTYSIGLLKSYDGGLTWNTTGMQFQVSDFVLLKELIINPLDTNSLTLATSQGLYKSNDGGSSFTQISTGHFKQLVYHPVDTNVIYAAGRTGGTNDDIFRSDNGGYSWTKRTTLTNSGNLRLAVTPVNPSIVKAVVSNSQSGLEGIYSSSDTGFTYTKIYDDSSCTRNLLSGNLAGTGCGGQGWYDLSIAISNVDSNLVIIGGINSWVSQDGGKYFRIANQWYNGLPGVKTVHADKHFHAFHPNRPGVLFECNDGGIYRTNDPTSTLWNDITKGMGITQFYRNAVSNINPAIIGGSQDNGSKRLIDGVNRDLTGGDGMNCEMDPVVANTIYTSSQYGTLYRSTNNGSNFTNISNNIPGQPTGSWVTPYAISPHDNNVLIAGYNSIFYSPDRGNSWVNLNSGLSSNTCRRISLSPVDPNYIYANWSTSLIRYTDDLGSSWKNISTNFYGSITDLHADPDTASKIWMTFSGFNGNKVANYNIATNKWTVLNDSLPKVPVQCMIIDTNNKTLYVGTDFGVYYRDTTMNHWMPYMTGLPNIEVTDLGIDYTRNRIVASTYGRGMWHSPRHEFPPVSGVSIIPFKENALRIFPNPGKGAFTVELPQAEWRNKQVIAQVYNTAGVMVQKVQAMVNSNGMLSLENELSSGTYILEIIQSNNLRVKGKFVQYR